MNKQQARMPKGVIPLYFIKAYSTFSYATLYSSLALFITKELGLESSFSNGIVGLFLAFNYVMQLFGGVLGGSYLSNRALFLITAVIQSSGLFFLAKFQGNLLYISLSLYLVGCGLNTTSYYNMLTQRFDANDNRREKAFFFNYAVLNFGFFVGYFCSGFYDYSNHYGPLFYLSTLANTLSLFFLVANWKVLADRETPLLKINNTLKQQAKNIKGVILIMFLIPLILFCFKWATLSNYLIIALSLVMFVLILYLRKQQKNLVDRQKLLAYLILAVTSIIFWMIYYTGPMGITLFIKNNVDKHLFNFEIATQWILNVNTVVIILGAPTLSIVIDKLRNKGFIFSISRQFFSAFVMLSLSFFCLAYGIKFANSEGYSSASWVIGHYFFQAIAELLIAPVGYAMIGRIAPINLQGLLMGIWTMTSGVAATLSHYFSNAMTKASSIHPLITNNNYLYVFQELGMWALAGAIFLYFIANKISQYIDDSNQEESVLADGVPT
ncbi:peptide MFS transporter [Legionella sp. D16C41]|uniref:peptide MFS transporter n=1 Tax=Legionella sp. D16C41 TaxID=3402688 RepID=UPI003AF9D5C6